MIQPTTLGFVQIKEFLMEQIFHNNQVCITMSFHMLCLPVTITMWLKLLPLNTKYDAAYHS